MMAAGRPGRAAASLCLSAVLASVGLGTYGCHSTGSGKLVAGEGGPIVQPVEVPMLRGIPVPEGFRLIDNRSSVENRGSTRVAHCEFEGDLAVADVVRFYEQTMPSAGFRAGPQSFNKGEHRIRFESDSEECTVLVKPKFMGKTALAIDVGPLPRGSATPEREPAAPRRNERPTR